MDTKTVDRIFAACILLLGLYVAWNALAYGYRRGTTPGPGFFPFWSGLALMGLSVVNLVRSLRGVEALDARFDAPGVCKTLGLIGAVVAFILIVPLLGMLIGSGLLVLATAFVLRPHWTAAFTLKIVAIAVLFPICAHFLFAVYLRVPLAKGVFGF